MKTIIGMKKIAIYMILASFLNPFVSLADLGSAGGGGGAALEDENGKVQTFTSAGIKMNVNQPLTEEDLKEEMQELRGIFLNQYISPEIKAKAMGIILPTVESNLPNSRNYYAIQYSDLDYTTKQKIIQLYQQRLKLAMKNSNEYENMKNRILQVGFTIGRNTYLLPKFFELRKASERVAILFHESLWVVNPNLSYDTVLSGESLMQKHIENRPPFDLELFGFLSSLFNKKMSLVWSALKYDIENQGGIYGLISRNGKIDFKSIYSDKTLRVLSNPKENITASGMIASDLNEKMKKYSKSYFLRALHYVRSTTSLVLKIEDQDEDFCYDKDRRITIDNLEHEYFRNRSKISLSKQEKVEFAGSFDVKNINLDARDISETLYRYKNYGYRCVPVKQLVYTFAVDKN